MSEVRSPRIFGRPMWSWASQLVYGSTLQYHIARPVVWVICRVLTGHRQAAGERGYMGGQIEVFCAYCCYPWTVPADEMPSAQHLVDLFHSEPPR